MKKFYYYMENHKVHGICVDHTNMTYKILHNRTIDSIGGNSVKMQDYQGMEKLLSHLIDVLHLKHYKMI